MDRNCSYQERISLNEEISFCKSKSHCHSVYRIFIKDGKIVILFIIFSFGVFTEEYSTPALLVLDVYVHLPNSDASAKRKNINLSSDASAIAEKVGANSTADADDDDASSQSSSGTESMSSAGVSALSKTKSGAMGGMGSSSNNSTLGSSNSNIPIVEMHGVLGMFRCDSLLPSAAGADYYSLIEHSYFYSIHKQDKEDAAATLKKKGIKAGGTSSTASPHNWTATDPVTGTETLLTYTHC